MFIAWYQSPIAELKKQNCCCSDSVAHGMSCKGTVRHKEDYICAAICLGAVYASLHNYSTDT